MTSSFADFDDLWRARTPSFKPVSKTVAALSDADRAQLMDKVLAGLPAAPDGSMAYSARAHAIKARVPA